MPHADARRTHLLVNLLVLPGLGTFAGGRRLAGVAQAVLALAGFALTLLWVGSYALAWWRLGWPPDALGPRAAAGLAGLALFAAAWLWSLVSALSPLPGTRRPAGKPPSS